MKNYFLMTIFLLFSLNSYAANVDQNTINQQDWITRQQQNKIEEDRRLKEQETIYKERARKKKESAVNEGEAKVYIANQKIFPAHATVGYDNLGNDFTGVKRTNFSGGLDNLLSLNDSINLSYSTNLSDNSQEKDIKSFSMDTEFCLSVLNKGLERYKSEIINSDQGSQFTSND